MRASAIVIAVVFALTACAPDPSSERDDPMTDSTLTLEVAKAQTIALGDEIASFFPPAFVQESRTAQVAKALLPCSGDESYGWPGRTTLTVSDVGDQAAALDAIAEEWGSREGWKVERLSEGDGRAGLDLTHLDGSTARVSFMRDATEVWIDVVSPCFVLPGGSRYGDEY